MLDLPQAVDRNPPGPTAQAGQSSGIPETSTLCDVPGPSMPGADRAHAVAGVEWASVDPSVKGPGRCAKCYDWTLFFKTSQLKSNVFLVTRAQHASVYPSSRGVEIVYIRTQHPREVIFFMG